MIIEEGEFTLLRYSAAMEGPEMFIKDFDLYSVKLTGVSPIKTSLRPLNPPLSDDMEIPSLEARASTISWPTLCLVMGWDILPRPAMKT